MAKPFVIGLTGPTGAGKSTVAESFAALGCGVIDCDLVAREVTSSPVCLQRLQEAFGPDLVRKGRLDRGLLAERAFATRESALRLNQITHPLILEEVQRKINQYGEQGIKVVVVDAALLFESGADAQCDTTVAVVADLQLRMRRIIRRDGIFEGQARARISAQQPNEYYTGRAAYAMDGGVPAEQVPQETKKLLRAIMTAAQ